MNVKARLKFLKVKLREISVPWTSPPAVLIRTCENTQPASAAIARLCSLNAGSVSRGARLFNSLGVGNSIVPTALAVPSNHGYQECQAICVLHPAPATRELVALDCRHAGQTHRQIAIGVLGGGIEENQDERSLVVLEPVSHFPKHPVLWVLEPVCDGAPFQDSLCSDT